MCDLLVIFYFMGNHRSYKTFVRVSRFFLKRRILLYDTTIFRYVLVVLKNYEAAVVYELEFGRDDFTTAVLICSLEDAFPLRACEWVLVAGLGGILLATSGESKEHDSEEHEDVL